MATAVGSIGAVVAAAVRVGKSPRSLWRIYNDCPSREMGDSSLRIVTLSALCKESKVPWKECNVMDERLKFVAWLLDGEKMAVLCREFDISRKTGYKILTRYNDSGLEGLTD